MSSPTTTRRFFRVVVTLFGLIVAATVGDLLLVRSRQTIHPGFETTRVTLQRLPDGSIDYLGALESYFSHDVTPDNNAAIPLLQALGRAALPPNQPRDGITDRLGMPPLPDKGDYYITYADYFRSRTDIQDAQLGDFSKPLVWPVAVGDPAVEWVNANEKPLALMTEASKRSRYFIPFNGGNRPTTLISILLPHLSLLQDARCALLTRAIVRLNNGDTTGFADDIRTGHRLARLLAQDSTLVGRMVAVELERSTCHVQRLGIVSGRLSPEMMRQMLAELSQMGDLPPLQDSVDHCERYLGLDVMQAMSRADDRGRAELFNGLVNTNHPAVVYRFWPIDYDKCMSELNQGYDTSIAALNKATYAERVRALAIQNMQLDMKKQDGIARMMLSSDWPQVILLPGLWKATERMASAQMEGRLIGVSLALELFKSDHGHYPATLSELSPAYLPSVPVDVFSDQPLVYAQSADGYAMHSVGPNMKDEQAKGDDVAVSVP